MDTHIERAPDLQHAGAPLQSPVRLPGARGTLPHYEPPEDVVGNTRAYDARTQQPPRAPAEQSAAPAPVAVVVAPRRRRRLLGTVATLALLAGSADAVWLHRHDIISLPWPASMTAALKAGEARLRPQLASWLGTLRTAALQAAAALPTPKRAVAAPSRPAPAADTEFASLKPEEGQPETAVNHDVTSAHPASAGPLSAPTEVGVAVVPANAVRPARPAAAAAAPASATTPPVTPTLRNTTTTPAVPPPAAAASPTNTTVALAAPLVTSAAVPPASAAPPPGPTTTPSPAAAPKPRDVAEAAIKLLAAPLAPKQQVEVVGFVRELGAQLKDTRTTVAQLNDTVTQLKEENEKRATDFDTRLSFAEAANALVQSAKAGEKAKPGSAAAQLAIHPVALTQGIAAVPASPSRTAKEFRIQGASPGLVVLNALNPAAGEALVLYKALGDQVPGLGRIKAIYQRGTRWLVQTDGGLIQ